jgi:hypothetical protein
LDRWSITLCPQAFGDNAALWETLGDVTANANSGKTGQPLDQQGLRAITFMHEMIHLVEGPLPNQAEGMVMPDKACKLCLFLEGLLIVEILTVL